MGLFLSTPGRRTRTVAALIVLYSIIAVRRKRRAAQTREQSLDGKTVVVNGVGSGVGHYIALECGARGATVVVVDCSDGSAASCANVIDMRNGRAFCFSCDTTDEKTLNEKLLVPLGRLIQDKKIAPVEVVIDVNVRPPVDGKLAQPLHMLSMESIKKEFDVAALGHFTVLRAFLSEMIQSNRGTLAIVSSSAAITGVANQSHFCANQFAACGLTDALRTELCEYGLDGINVFWACVHLNMIDATVFSGQTHSKQQLCPPVKLQNAAYKIIDGICRRDSTLFVPSYLGAVSCLRGLLPMRIFNWFCALLGLSGWHNHLSNQI
ncbi:short chain dehydrogenase [Plasmodiophora brassicae]|uniref:Uncharacterized protein n=1 Tax=Plasmodiophora brassicae TaxID=37360 RepID=A0A0G4IGT1_PLABS|nr:hypothetical protein PBRA_000212 [Plasmodiophora brassicae]